MAKKKKISSGLLMYRFNEDILEFLLAHPGGPCWINRYEDAWTIPKGEVEEDEDLFSAAVREFTEETGLVPGHKMFYCLGTITQKSGKVVHAWAFEGKWDEGDEWESNTCTIFWPRNSDNEITIPEIDEIKWFSLEDAVGKINPAQFDFLERISRRINQ